MADIIVTIENHPPATVNVDGALTINGLGVGTIATGAPGTNVLVTITGAPPNQKVNFVIPRGNTGEKGDTGDTGPAGPTVPDDGTVTAAKLASVLNLSGKTITLPSNLIVPVGSVIYFPASTPPSGFLKANGAAISRATYAELFALIGTNYGNGNGSTTYNLPDLRGEFLRVWDDGRGVDSGRGLGTAQGQMIQNHTHAYSTYAGTTSGSNGAESNHLRNTATLDSGNPNTGGGAETRPRNVALLACIKFAP